MTGPSKLTLVGIGSYDVAPHFHSQLASRYEIPKAYYDRMSKIPGLQEETVNRFFEHHNERRLVRTLDENARAFLSDRYKVIDNLFVMEPFMEALLDYKKESGGEFEIKANGLTSRRMYLEVSFPNITGEIISTGRGKEVVNAGAALVNSEVGLSEFDVRSFLWWQWCANGAIAESLIRRRHVGRRIGDNEDDYAIYSDKTIKLEMDAFRSRLKDVFDHVLTEDAFQDVVRKIQSTVNDKVEKPQTLIKNVTKRFVDITEADGEKILANMVTEGNMNRYGLMNGITRLAQEIEDADKGYELEKLGVQVMELPKGQWEVLAEDDNMAA
jgi:hypothetical protein